MDVSPEIAEMLIAAGAQIDTIDKVQYYCFYNTCIGRKFSLYLLTSFIHVHTVISV